MMGNKPKATKKRDGSYLGSCTPVHILIRLYFSSLCLVLLHGLQYKWRTFMMQMQAGAINLSLTPLSWALLTQKDVLCFLSLSRSISRSPAHSGTLLHFLSLSCRCGIVLHLPPGHMKNESGPGDAVRMWGLEWVGRVWWVGRNRESRELEAPPLPPPP